MYRLFYAYPLWADHPRGYRFILRKLLRVFHLGEAVRAIDRAVLTGLEGDFRLGSTARADSGKHLSLGSCIVLARIAASFASLRLVHKASFSINSCSPAVKTNSAPHSLHVSVLSVYILITSLKNWIYPLELRRPRLISSSANRCQRVYMQSLYGTVTK